jgi:hypothetical protein
MAMRDLIGRILKLNEDEIPYMSLRGFDIELTPQEAEYWNDSKLVRSLINDYKGITGKMLNFGRDSGAIDNSNAAVYSAVLDGKICPLCKFLNGMVFKVGSEEHKRFTPPLHNNCRCIFIYVRRDYMPQPVPNFKEPPENFTDKHGQFIIKNILSSR